MLNLSVKLYAIGAYVKATNFHTSFDFSKPITLLLTPKNSD